jgi:GT2 family glycosyltransferase
VKVVTIVVLNWNSAEDTLACFLSLLQLRFDCENTSINIVLVDNHSLDESWETIKQGVLDLGFLPQSQWPYLDLNLRHETSSLSICLSPALTEFTVFLVRSERNLGYAGGNNIGIEMGIHFNSDYFWILNNDTCVDPFSLKLFLCRMRSDPSVGICGATILDYESPNNLQSLGGSRYSFLSGRGSSVLLSDFDSVVTNELVEAEVDYISGACMFVSGDFIKTIGPLSEDYFLYCEEMDWVQRAGDRYRLGVELKAVIYHKEGASLGTEKRGYVGSVMAAYYVTRSKLILTKKYSLITFPVVWGVQFIKGIRYYLNGHKLHAMVVFRVCFGSRKFDIEGD